MKNFDDYVSAYELFSLYYQKHNNLYRFFKEMLKDDYDMFEYFGIYSAKKSILMIMKKEYAQTDKKTDRFIQFNIIDGKVDFLEGTELDIKKEFYNKNKEKINKMFLTFYEDIFFESINCETFIKDMFFSININNMTIILEDNIKIVGEFDMCKYGENPFDNFIVNLNDKKIIKRIKKEKYSVEELLKIVKIKNDNIPLKILKQIKENRDKSMLEEEKTKNLQKR